MAAVGGVGGFKICRFFTCLKRGIFVIKESKLKAQQSANFLDYRKLKASHAYVGNLFPFVFIFLDF